MNRDNRPRRPRRTICVLAILLLAPVLSMPISSQVVAADEPASKRKPTAVGKLLDKLDELRRHRGEDEWASTMRDLIKQGSPAVPELIAELDATNDDAMLRCLGFVLRGIGDKRAIPGLIRALPKTCVPPGSDYGMVANDPELLAFMQKHDKDGKVGGTQYSFGRSINEIRAALQKLAGQKQGEDELVFVFLGGSPRQQFLQRSLLQSCAERWAAWWELHWKEHVKDDHFAKVNLPALAEVPDTGLDFPHGPDCKIGEGSHGNVLQSVRNPKAKQVFYDLDTGRQSGLPKHLQTKEGLPERLDDILAWASREGFDLMGTEYTLPGSDKPHYMLRGIGLTTWQIDTDRWKTLGKELLEDKPLDMGLRTDGLLGHFDVEKGVYEPEETATFLFQTREGTYGALFVGVEVLDDKIQIGAPLQGDQNLNPVAFFKGRRFGYMTVWDPAANADAKSK